MFDCGLLLFRSSDASHRHVFLWQPQQEFNNCPAIMTRCCPMLSTCFPRGMVFCCTRHSLLCFLVFLFVLSSQVRLVGKINASRIIMHIHIFWYSLRQSFWFPVVVSPCLFYGFGRSPIQWDQGIFDDDFAICSFVLPCYLDNGVCSGSKKMFWVYCVSLTEACQQMFAEHHVSVRSSGCGNNSIFVIWWQCRCSWAGGWFGLC